MPVWREALPVLRGDGPWLRKDALIPEHSTLIPLVRWHNEIQRVVEAQEPWALYGEGATGTFLLFDTSADGLFRCAGWAIAVQCVFPTGRRWEIDRMIG